MSRTSSDGRLRTGLCGLLAAAWLMAWPARAEPAAERRGAILEVDEENDWFAGTDRHYTQGARMVYLGAERSAEQGWTAGWPAIVIRPAAVRWGAELGQSIYTPENLAARLPVNYDRPYAGWLYAGAVLQRRGTTAGGLPAWENIRLQLGVIGPASLAEAQQELAHFIGGFQKAYGWANQLHNEPGLALKVQRAWRLAPWKGLADNVDVIPHAGGSLGNVDTSLRAGALLRLGWRLPDDFGVQTIDSLALSAGGRSASAADRTRSCYFFGGIEGRAVAYNAFLDGDLFQNSQSVDKRPFVFELKTGLAIQWNRVDLAFSLVFRSEEFVGQNRWDDFGAIVLQWNFQGDR